MAIRGVRGAVVATDNTKEAMSAATRELVKGLLLANPTLDTVDVASAYFTVTDDLDATHPALAARELGWHNVPLLCAREIPVPGSMPMCIRVLLHWNTELPQDAVHHVYLGKAAQLRPDLPSTKWKTVPNTTLNAEPIGNGSPVKKARKPLSS